MNDDVDGLLMQYREAVRLVLWYEGSPHSVHQGKSSKDLAATYRNLAHKLLVERSNKLREGSEGFNR